MGTERTLEAWRIEAISMLARIARKQGLARLRQDPLLNKVVNIVGTYAIEETLEQPIPTPTEEEALALRSRAIRMLQEYPLLKAKANAAKPQLTLGLDKPAPPPAPAPPPVEVIPTAPPRQYTMQHLADPLFVREMTKSPAGPKPRDIKSPEAVGNILGRQTDAIAAFFAPNQTAESTAVENTHAWTAHFELGESLCVVAGPWKGLPGFVKKLDLVSGDHRQNVLAGNLRNGRTRIEVPPSADEVRFFGGEYDEEIGADLAALRLPGFTTVRATAFRVDVNGEGKLLTGAVLSPGRTYRILVPPEFEARELAGDAIKNLPGGWTCFEYALPNPMTPDIEEKLLRLGLATARTTLDVDFVGVAAREYREGRSSERYACFASTDAPVIAIRGVETHEPGQFALFLAGPSGQTRFDLPAAKDFLVKIGPLPEGRYALDVLSSDMTREPERILFEVDDRAGMKRGWPRAQASLTLESERMVLDGEIRRPVNLGNLDETHLRMEVPPLFPIGVRWEGEKSRRLSPLVADGYGVVPLADLFAQLEDERTFAWFGDLILDCAEFGRIVLHHHSPVQSWQLWTKASALYAERARVAKTMMDPSLVFKSWIEPLCRLFRYRLEPKQIIIDPATESPLRQILTFVLETVGRGEHGMVLEKVGMLVVCPRGTDFITPGPDDVHVMGERLARAEGVARVMFTDGLSWLQHERGRSFQRPAVNIVALFEDESGGPVVENENTRARFEEFLYQFHA